jgi:hypothetical protein
MAFQDSGFQDDAFQQYYSSEMVLMGNERVSVYKGINILLLTKEVDLTTDTLKLALLTEDYTVDTENQSTFDDVDSYEVSGTGYTAGGITLTGVTMGTGVDGEVTIMCNDAEWAAPTQLEAQYAVCYDSTHADDPLISVFDFGSIEASLGGANSVYIVPLSETGILTLENRTIGGT